VSVSRATWLEPSAGSQLDQPSDSSMFQGKGLIPPVLPLGILFAVGFLDDSCSSGTFATL
jgi:hypothetical protein